MAPTTPEPTPTSPLPTGPTGPGGPRSPGGPDEPGGKDDPDDDELRRTWESAMDLFRRLAANGDPDGVLPRLVDLMDEFSRRYPWITGE